MANSYNGQPENREQHGAVAKGYLDSFAPDLLDGRFKKKTLGKPRPTPRFNQLRASFLVSVKPLRTIYQASVTGGVTPCFGFFLGGVETLDRVSFLGGVEAPV